MTGPTATRRLRCRRVRALALIVLLAAGAGAAGQGDQNFQDWTSHCNAAPEDGPTRCYIFQNLVLTDSGQRLLHVAVGYPAQSRQPAVALTVPLGVSLKGGISLQVEEGRVTRIAYDRCDPNGCVATLPLDNRLLHELKMRGQARATFEDGTGRKVVVPVSLMGFTAGLESLN